MLSKEQFDTIAEPVKDELYAISGSGFGFPSSNYDDLELGASGTQYTAPANGWISLCKKTASANQYIILENSTKSHGVNSRPNVSGTVIYIALPVQKGDVVTITYDASGETKYFRFIYAEGE